MIARRMNDNDDHERQDHDCQRYQDEQHHRPSTCGEFAIHNPLLPNKEPSVPQKQDQDADSQEGCTQRLAHLSQRIVVDGRTRVGERGIQSEQLRDCDTNGCESQ